MLPNTFQKASGTRGISTAERAPTPQVYKEKVAQMAQLLPACFRFASGIPCEFAFRVCPQNLPCKRDNAFTSEDIPESFLLLPEIEGITRNKNRWAPGPRRVRTSGVVLLFNHPPLTPRPRPNGRRNLHPEMGMRSFACLCGVHVSDHFFYILLFQNGSQKAPKMIPHGARKSTKVTSD